MFLFGPKGAGGYSPEVIRSKTVDKLFEDLRPSLTEQQVQALSEKIKKLEKTCHDSIMGMMAYRSKTGAEDGVLAKAAVGAMASSDLETDPDVLARMHSSYCVDLIKTEVELRTLRGESLDKVTLRNAAVEAIVTDFFYYSSRALKDQPSSLLENLYLAQDLLELFKVNPRPTAEEIEYFQKEPPKTLNLSGGPLSIPDWFSERNRIILTGKHTTLRVKKSLGQDFNERESADWEDLLRWEEIALEKAQTSIAQRSHHTEPHSTVDDSQELDSYPHPNLSVESRESSLFLSELNKLQEIIWIEDFSSKNPIPIEYSVGLIVFTKPGFKSTIVDLAEATLKMAQGLAPLTCFKTDEAYQKELDGPRLPLLILAVYRLLVTNIWDIVGSRTNAKTASLVIDVLLIPLGIHPDEDEECQAYLRIDPLKTGPGDRPFECGKRMLAILGTDAEVDVLTAYMTLGPESHNQKMAASQFVEKCFPSSN